MCSRLTAADMTDLQPNPADWAGKERISHYIRVKIRSVAAVARVERLDQAVDAALLDLLRELVAVVLDQPDRLHVQVVDLPALRAFAQSIVDFDGLGIGAGGDGRAHD